MRQTHRPLLLLGLVLLFAVPATATQLSGGYVELPANRTVESLSASGGTVVIRGTVTGDAQIFASDVTVTGRIQGDLQVFSANTVLDGWIGGDVRVFSGNLRLMNGSRIGGRLQAFSGNTVLDGRINGSAMVATGALTLRPGTHILGNLSYTADSFRNHGRVDGRIIEEQQEPETSGIDVLGIMMGLGSRLMLGAVLILLAAGFTRDAMDHAEDRGAWKALTGFAFALATPFVLVLLALTVIGLPLALLGLFIYGTALGIGSIIGSLVVGRQLAHRAGSDSLYTALVVGSVAITALTLVPVIGPVLWLFVAFLGTGGLLRSVMDLWGDRYGE